MAMFRFTKLWSGPGHVPVSFHVAVPSLLCRFTGMQKCCQISLCLLPRHRVCGYAAVACFVCMVHPYAGALSPKPYFHCCRLATEEIARRGTGPSTIFTSKRVAAAVVSGRVCSSICAACHFSFSTVIYGKLCEGLISLIIYVAAARHNVAVQTSCLHAMCLLLSVIVLRTR